MGTRNSTAEIIVSKEAAAAIVEAGGAEGALGRDGGDPRDEDRLVLLLPERRRLAGQRNGAAKQNGRRRDAWVGHGGAAGACGASTSLNIAYWPGNDQEITSWISSLWPPTSDATISLPCAIASSGFKGVTRSVSRIFRRG